MIKCYLKNGQQGWDGEKQNKDKLFVNLQEELFRNPLGHLVYH